MPKGGTRITAYVTHALRSASASDVDMAKIATVCLARVCERHRMDVVTPGANRYPNGTWDVPTSESYIAERRSILAADLLVYIEAGMSGRMGWALAQAREGWVPIVGLLVEGRTP